MTATPREMYVSLVNVVDIDDDVVRRRREHGARSAAVLEVIHRGRHVLELDQRLKRDAVEDRDFAKLAADRDVVAAVAPRAVLAVHRRPVGKVPVVRWDGFGAEADATTDQTHGRGPRQSSLTGVP